jgi:hypothetical protein
MTKLMVMAVFLQQLGFLQQCYYYTTVAAFQPLSPPFSSSSFCCCCRRSSLSAVVSSHLAAASKITTTRPTTTTSTYRLSTSLQHVPLCRPLLVLSMSSSDWSTFQALDDDDDDDYLQDTTTTNNNNNNNNPSSIQYANENDPQEFKAQVGSNIPAPTVDWDGEPIFLPQGSILPLSEENVQGVLAACRQEIGTMFGYTAENRGVGITGGVDFVELDGPTVILKLHGRFWHQRTTVLERVGKYLQGRIPEIVDYAVEDPWELTDEANDVAY